MGILGASSGDKQLRHRVTVCCENEAAGDRQSVAGKHTQHVSIAFTVLGDDAFRVRHEYVCVCVCVPSPAGCTVVP